MTAFADLIVASNYSFLRGASPAADLVRRALELGHAGIGIADRNTVAGVGSFGGRAAYIGKVADDTLGGVFSHDITAAGVRFDTAPLKDGAAQGHGTGVCMINVTDDGQRTMCTFLGAANQLMDYTESMMRARIAEIPDGEYFAEGFLDDDAMSNAGNALVHLLKGAVK